MLSMRIPRWVEVTAGEVPATLSYRQDSEPLRRNWPDEVKKVGGTLRQPLGRNIITSLWGNCTIKVMVGFPVLVSRVCRQGASDPTAGHSSPYWASSVPLPGSAISSATSPAARLKLGRPSVLVVRCTVAVCAVAFAASVAGNLLMAAIATLITSGASAISKASLDASLQDDLPEESRASGFGRSESTLQLAWVLGGALGVLVYTELVGRFHRGQCDIDPGAGADHRQLPRRLLDPGPRRQSAGDGRTGRHAPERGQTRGGAEVKRGTAMLLAVSVLLVGGSRESARGMLVRPRGPQPRGDHRVFARTSDPCGALPLLQRAQPRRLPAAAGPRRAAQSTSTTRCSSLCPKLFRGHRGGYCRCMRIRPTPPPPCFVPAPGSR